MKATYLEAFFIVSFFALPVLFGMLACVFQEIDTRATNIISTVLAFVAMCYPVALIIVATIVY